ncbi:coiled-coil domain-containing protein CG32809-like isoform X2 [Limulus polyphemus]|uniref:Coiled-coil domain-containing protein CG32809-like isoform X2 n=1 Tax=Limulus polyphemus TaxID=6850 RepID=A0ABM1SRN2_LIMPO|nr:coiled-coil domain-containing protein CG32809-like isoform X2 [Limulus polyphemus]
MRLRVYQKIITRYHETTTIVDQFGPCDLMGTATILNVNLVITAMPNTAVHFKEPSSISRHERQKSHSSSSSSESSSDCTNTRVSRHRRRRSLLYQVLVSPLRKKSSLLSDLPCNVMMSNLGLRQGPNSYQPPPSVYEDDPGIMSEVETAATGFRRAIKARSSLPIVRTPSKTQERPLGMVFLQYRSETKRALLPNEITTLDTVKALFVRSFPKQLTMEYLDSPHLHIYIHDPSKDMFYELEDLRDIRDRSVLRIYEQDVNSGGMHSSFDQDLSYFSEPEFDSEYQHQHIHRAKGAKSSPNPGSTYYNTHNPYPPVSCAQTLPLGTSLRAFSPSPSEGRQKAQPITTPSYSQTMPRGSTQLLSYVPAPPSPVKRQRDQSLPPGSAQPPPKPQRSFQQALVPLTKAVHSTPPPTGPLPAIPSPRSAQPKPERPYPPDGQAFYHASPDRRYDPSYQSSPERRSHESGYLSSPERRPDVKRTFPPYSSATFDSRGYYRDQTYGSHDQAYSSRSGSTTPAIDEEARVRMEMMERQLASLRGLVQKALVSSPAGQPQDLVSSNKMELGGDKEEKDGRQLVGKPAPPPKPASLQYTATESRHHVSVKDLQGSPELYNQLRYLKKQTKDLRTEVRNLKRMAQAQAVTARESVRETCVRIKDMLIAAHGMENKVCGDRIRVAKDEEIYHEDVARLENDLSKLETTVEELRGNVINRKCRVNISDVESMALILSRASKTVADLKARFPTLQENLKAVMSAEMEVVVKEEKFLKDEPERLESALRRCKKLTGTLVTLKRLASVQEQRHTSVQSLPEKPLSTDRAHSDGEAHTAKSSRHRWKWSSSFKQKIDLRRGYSTTVKTIDSDPHTVIHVPPDSHRKPKAENALDALLDELQTFTKPSEQKRDSIPGLIGPQRRLPSYPSAESPVCTPTHSYGPPPTPQRSSAPPNTGGTVTGKLQVCDAGTRHSLSLSPAQSPVPENRNYQSQEVLARVSVSGTKHDTLPSRKVPPPPPPRTTSRSPLTSPTTPLSPASNRQKSSVNSSSQAHSHSRSNSEPGSASTNTLPKIASRKTEHREEVVIKKNGEVVKTSAINDDNFRRDPLSSNSSSSESVNSQEGLQVGLNHGSRHDRKMSGGIDSGKQQGLLTPSRSRQEVLEQRHQELLRKQKQLQEQYTRLQQLQRGQLLQRFSPPRSGMGLTDLKKTGSESNILSKTALSLTPASGSLTHLAVSTATINLTPKAPASQSNSITSSAIITNNTNDNGRNSIKKTNIDQSGPGQIFETDIL